MQQRSFKSTRELFAEVGVANVRQALVGLKAELEASRAELKRTVGHKYRDLLLSSDQVVSALRNAASINETLEEVPLQCSTTLAPFSRPVPAENVQESGEGDSSDVTIGAEVPVDALVGEAAKVAADLERSRVALVVEAPESVAKHLAADDPESAATAFLRARQVHLTMGRSLNHTTGSALETAVFVRRQWKSTACLEDSIVRRARSLLWRGAADNVGDSGFSPARSRKVCASAARALITLGLCDSRGAFALMLEGREAELALVLRHFHGDARSSRAAGRPTVAAAAELLRSGMDVLRGAAVDASAFCPWPPRGKGKTSTSLVERGGARTGVNGSSGDTVLRPEEVRWRTSKLLRSGAVKLSKAAATVLASRCATLPQLSALRASTLELGTGRERGGGKEKAKASKTVWPRLLKWLSVNRDTEDESQPTELPPLFRHPDDVYRPAFSARAASLVDATYDMLFKRAVRLVATTRRAVETAAAGETAALLEHRRRKKQEEAGLLHRAFLGLPRDAPSPLSATLPILSQTVPLAVALGVGGASAVEVGAGMTAAAVAIAADVHKALRGIAASARAAGVDGYDDGQSSSAKRQQQEERVYAGLAEALEKSVRGWELEFEKGCQASKASGESPAEAAAGAAAARGLLLATRVAYGLSAGADSSASARRRLVAVGKRAADSWGARLAALLPPLARRCAREAAEGANDSRGNNGTGDASPTAPSGAIVRLLHNASQVSAGAFDVPTGQRRRERKAFNEGHSDEVAAEAAILAALSAAAPVVTRAVAEACRAEYSAAVQGAQGQNSTGLVEAKQMQLLLDLRFAAGPRDADEVSHIFADTIGTAQYATMLPELDAAAARAAAASSLLLNLGVGIGGKTEDYRRVPTQTVAAEAAGTMALCSAPPPLSLLPVPSLRANVGGQEGDATRTAASGTRGRVGGSSSRASRGGQRQRQQRLRQQHHHQQQQDKDASEDMDVLSNVGNLANKLFSGWN